MRRWMKAESNQFLVTELASISTLQRVRYVADDEQASGVFLYHVCYVIIDYMFMWACNVLLVFFGNVTLFMKV
jgi:hypothetical protein